MSLLLELGIFKKESDMKCWNCDKLINHKKVKWKKRTYTAESLASNPEQLEASINLANAMGQEPDEEVIASPNQIFGFLEYEYCGKCPKCSGNLRGFWFGKDSFNDVNGIKIGPKRKPFFCNICEKPIERGHQVWYSIMIQEKDEAKEILATLCPHCNTEQGYPFEYNLESGIIK